MEPSEQKIACDLISLVANAVATHTEEECIEYLSDKRFNSTEEAQLIHHCINVLNQINEQQYELPSIDIG